MSNYDWFDGPSTREPSYDVGDRYLDHAGYVPPTPKEQPVSCSDNEQDGYDYIRRRNREMKEQPVAEYGNKEPTVREQAKATAAVVGKGTEKHTPYEGFVQSTEKKVGGSITTEFLIKKRGDPAVALKWDSREDAEQALAIIKESRANPAIADLYYGEQVTTMTETEEF